jgi:hypothetical protein
VVTDVNAHEQFVIDLPEIEPKIMRYMTESGGCSRCGRRVRSRHPEQISAVEFLVKVQRATDGAIPSLIPAPQLDTSRPRMRCYPLRGWINQQ